MFAGRVISRFGDIAQLTSSPNLSVPCHFLWGSWRPKCAQTNLAQLKRKQSRSERFIEVCCMQLRVISDQDYRNILHARETTKEMKFLKSEERALNDILLLIFHFFSYIQPNSSKLWHENCHFLSPHPVVYLKTDIVHSNLLGQKFMNIIHRRTIRHLPIASEFFSLWLCNIKYSKYIKLMMEIRPSCPPWTLARLLLVRLSPTGRPTAPCHTQF
jgi:hypothetical protein